MKRMICIVMILALIAGCAKKAPEKADIPAQSEETLPTDDLPNISQVETIDTELNDPDLDRIMEDIDISGW